jgi:hypothetical protein
MADISVSEGKELVIPGTDPIVYDKVVIQTLTFINEPDGRIICNAQFRYYRILEDSTIEWSPISAGTPSLAVHDLRMVLGAIEGGTQLKDAVAEAIIGIAKMQGLI